MTEPKSKFLKKSPIFFVIPCFLCIFAFTKDETLRTINLKPVEKESEQKQDELYLSLLKDGDKDAFNAIFHRYYKPLCIYAYRFVTFEDVEEIVQDIFLWLWQNHETLFIHTNLSAFLYKSVHLKCLTKVAQNTAKKRRETLYWEKYIKDTYSDVSNYQMEELIKDIHAAINRLPDKYREAFVLHRFHDYTYKDIAEKLNISPKTVDYRIQKALALLREDLKEYFPLLFLPYFQHFL